MLEWSSHLLSKVVPKSEREYAAALTMAYNDTVKKLLASDISTQKRLLKIISEIQKELYLINDKLILDLPDEIAEIIKHDAAYYEQEFRMGYDAAATAAIGSKLYSIPTSTMKEFSKLRTLNFYHIDAKGALRKSKTYTAESMLKGISKKQAEVVKAIILGEYAKGSSTETIVKKLKPYMTDSTKQNARMVIRTLLKEASTKAQKRFNLENEQYIDGFIFVAVLDGKTSQLCASLDGKRFKTGKAWYEPPLHPRCRSDLNPVSKGYELGKRPIVILDKKGKAVEIIRDKNFTFAEALKRYPQLSNVKLIDVDKYIKDLGV